MEKIRPLATPVDGEVLAAGGASWLLLSQRKNESSAAFTARTRRCVRAYEQGFVIDWNTGKGPPQGRVNWYHAFGGYYRLETRVQVFNSWGLRERLEGGALILGKIYAPYDSTKVRPVARAVLYLPEGLPSRLWNPPTDISEMHGETKTVAIERALFTTICPRVQEYKSNFVAGIPLDTFAWRIPSKIWMEGDVLRSAQPAFITQSVKKRCKCGISSYGFLVGENSDIFQCVSCRGFGVPISTTDTFPRQQPQRNAQSATYVRFYKLEYDDIDCYCGYYRALIYVCGVSQGTATSGDKIVRGEPQDRKAALVAALGVATGTLVDALYDADLVYAQDTNDVYYVLGDVVFSPTFSGFLLAMKRNPGRYKEFIRLI